MSTITTSEPTHVPAFADRFCIATPQGGEAAARAIAASFTSMAGAVECQRETTSGILVELRPAWRGGAADCMQLPAQSLVNDLDAAADGLRRVARAFEAYADQLHHAHQRHHWSVGRIVAVGLTVTVIAGAIVVTGGAALAAGSAAAAEVGAEVAAVGAAAVAAAEAGSAATLALTESAGLASTIGSLWSFALPHLAVGAIGAGSDLLAQEIRGDGVQWGSVATSFAIGGLSSGATSGLLGRVGASTAWAELSPAARFLATHLAVGGVAAGGDVAGQLLTRGDVDWGEVGVAGGSGFVLSAGPDGALRLVRAVKITSPFGRIDLVAHEGVNGGHTVADHIGLTQAQALRRLASDPTTPFVSSFLDLETANSAVTTAIGSQRRLVSEWLAGTAKGLQFDVTLRSPIGMVWSRNGTAELSSAIRVVLKKEGTGFIVFTTFPRFSP